jgi:DNA gyrase/topoisomerase IV subunit A
MACFLGQSSKDAFNGKGSCRNNRDASGQGRQDHRTGRVKKNASLFIVTEKGFGKRVNYQHFTNKGRGGKEWPA